MIEPRQRDAVENPRFRRRLRAAMEGPRRPPLLTLADVRAFEDADVAPENRSRPGPPPCQAPTTEGA